MPQLTPREEQVMRCLVRGYSNKDVARSLGISPRTVENFRHQVMRKMGVENVVMLTRRVYGITDAEAEQ